MNQQKLHHINNYFETVIKLSDYTLAPPFNTTIKISKDLLLAQNKFKLDNYNLNLLANVAINQSFIHE
jgi:hypothetical protein